MARYRDAIEWLARNDDNSWADSDPESGDGAISVSAGLVADLFNKSDETVRADLCRALDRLEKERSARK
jgi:hypothetical protein